MSDNFVTDLKVAEEAFLEGDFENASELYTDLSMDHPDNPYLLINKGNAELRLKKYGKSIKSYYQAKKDLPRNKELNNNLALAIEEIQLSQPALMSYSYMTWVEAFILVLIFNIIFLFRKKFSRSRSVRFLLGFCLSVTVANFGYIAIEQKVKKHGVITSLSAQAYSGNDKGYAKIFELYDGQIVEILRRERKWSKIKVDKNLGWVKNKDISLI